MGPALLAAAVTAGGAARLPALRHDYAQMRPRMATRAWNWASGVAARPAMTLRLDPPPRVVDDGNLPVTGHFTAPDPCWYVNGVLAYFHKRALSVRPPG